LCHRWIAGFDAEGFSSEGLDSSQTPNGKAAQNQSAYGKVMAKQKNSIGFSRG
jgi:hypothetical protein